MHPACTFYNNPTSFFSFSPIVGLCTLQVFSLSEVIISLAIIIIKRKKKKVFPDPCLQFDISILSGQATNARAVRTGREIFSYIGKKLLALTLRYHWK